MKNVTQFDKPTLRALRPEIQEALAVLAKEAGMSVNVGKIKYSDTNATFTIDFLIEGSKSPTERDVELFTKFKAGDLVDVRGLGIAKVVGYKHRNRKYPLIVQSGNKTYKIPTSAAQAS